MSTTLIVPPTLSELLEDPVYRRYLLKAPRLPAGCRPALPWRVWGLREDDRWAGKEFPTYAEGFELVKKMLKDPLYVDVAIICKPTEFAPPPGYRVPSYADWCGRCRRPTIYRRGRRHHATRRWPVVADDNPYRCFYCGMRQPEHKWY